MDPVVVSVSVSDGLEIVGFSCGHRLTLRVSPVHRFRAGDHVECQDCRYNQDTTARQRARRV